LIISDVEPTTGEFPMDETIKAIQSAFARNISISIIGVDMKQDGEELAKKIINITRGKLYVLKSLDELDNVVLEDYYSL
jgi:Mg-chelatase subunit ChlD